MLLKIDSSTIGMESARKFQVRSSRSLGVSAALKERGQTREGKLNGFSDLLESEAGDKEVDERVKNVKTQVPGMRNLSDYTYNDEMRSIEEIKMQCMHYILYWLFGGKYRDCIGDGFKGLSSMGAGQSMMRIETSYEEYYGEFEETEFSTVGTVKTADGREINFNLAFTMSRSFEEYYQTKEIAEIVGMMDPLVINLDNNLAGLSDQKFKFDLDGDGNSEDISLLNKGSGYLALDKNEDGLINDGTELFGTKSGDGFADLMIYDEDHNGWIDENDEIFSKLRIWTKDPEGNDELYYLKEAGVGAICLRKADTQFSMNSLKDNHTNGMLRSSGIFLYENGNVGTIQQMDLAV